MGYLTLFDLVINGKLPDGCAAPMLDEWPTADERWISKRRPGTKGNGSL
jgi:hypothetical protein